MSSRHPHAVWFALVPLAVAVVLITAWRDRHRPIPEEALV